MRLDEIFRINELAGLKAHNPVQVKTLAELQRFMARFGFVQIGGGEFSRVFENPKLNDVVKVYNDECYDRFVAFCKAHPDNPHLPRFKGNSIRLRSDARMIRIERLELLDAKDRANFSALYKVAEERANPKYDPENDFWDVPPEDQLLLDTITELLKTRGPCWIDMLGNVMKRGNTLVIVDPYAPDRDGWASTHK